MINNLRNKYYEKWSIVYAAVFILIAVLLTAESVFPQVHAVSHFFFSRYAFVLLLGSYLVFNGFKAETEIKLLAAYALWYLLTRIFNSGFMVNLDDKYSFNMFLYIAMITTVGAVLSERKRELFTKAVIWPVSIFYTVMAGFVIYTYISGKDVYLPCFEEAFSTFLGYRAFLAEENPNITAYWFMATGFFALWIFAKYKNTFAKFMSVLVFVMNYIALTAADSRNCKVAFSVGVSIIIIMLVLKRLKNKTTAKTALAVIATAIIALPLVYGSFGFTANLSGKLAESVEEYQASKYTETAVKAGNYYCSNLRREKNTQN